VDKMDIRSGDILIFAVDNMTKVWKISKVDSNVVKIFEEDGSYRQMPYSYLVEMRERGYIKIETPDMVW